MKFGNVVLLCKGWYKYRDNNRPDLFWMDMAHAINADGWLVSSRDDVAKWCLHRLDDMRNDEKLQNYSNQFTFAYIYENVESFLNIKKSKDIKVSRSDALIWVYRNIVFNLSSKDLDEDRIVPNSNVLPFYLQNAWYDACEHSKWHAPMFYFAEMKCDYLERVSKMFPNAVEQKIPNYEFDRVETFLKKDSWKDVLVLPGEDNLNDCIELKITALELQNCARMYDKPFGSSSRIKRIVHSCDMGKFENCKDIEECEDPKKEYIVRISNRDTRIPCSDVFTLKSIKEV